MTGSPLSSGKCATNIERDTICARSKRWWSEEIREKRRALGRAVRRRRAGRGGEAEVKVAKKELRREIRRARRECWERFLSEASGEDVWAIGRYVGPGRSSIVRPHNHAPGGHGGHT